MEANADHGSTDPVANGSVLPFIAAIADAPQPGAATVTVPDWRAAAAADWLSAQADAIATYLSPGLARMFEVTSAPIFTGSVTCAAASVPVETAQPGHTSLRNATPP